MNGEMELVNRIFSEPNLVDLEKDLRALDPALQESLKIFESLDRRSSGSWSEFSISSVSSGSESERLFNRRGSFGLYNPRASLPAMPIHASNLSLNAPEFVPSTYAAAVSKFSEPVACHDLTKKPPRFVVPILKKPVAHHQPKIVPEITANNMPRPPIRMTPATLKKFSPPEIILPVFQASFQISAKSGNPLNAPQHITPYRKTCEFCKNNGESRDQYQSHCLKNPLTGRIVCPLMREYVCEVCKSTGDDSHLESKCPLNLIAKDNPTLLELTMTPNRRESSMGRTR